MKEEIARQASRILSEIVDEEQKLSEFTEMQEYVLSEDNVLEILYIIRRDSDLFAPTLKKYIAGVLDKAITEKKELINSLKLKLDQL